MPAGDAGAAGDGDGRWWHLQATVLPITLTPTKAITGHKTTKLPPAHPVRCCEQDDPDYTFLPLSVPSREDMRETRLVFYEFFHGWCGRQHGREAWMEIALFSS